MSHCYSITALPSKLEVIFSLLVRHIITKLPQLALNALFHPGTLSAHYSSARPQPQYIDYGACTTMLWKMYLLNTQSKMI